ncbi:MAG: hypothetical protein AVDCRST_MAG49-3897 [uncultured Thermomicrobiales bacterium]|uniref:Uncharacterized protein n=1 Tax=uncultured Thermomicrobiales bacterium TaxID=1645740 RepID=A0A6J4VH94_9BACT|nr:MAG: hypothetical protein AVDCRST_MAG49-3897 [uncultured Thermomicrobiales bacterium]
MNVARGLVVRDAGLPAIFVSGASASAQAAAGAGSAATTSASSSSQVTAEAPQCRLAVVGRPVVPLVAIGWAPQCRSFPRRQQTRSGRPPSPLPRRRPAAPAPGRGPRPSTRNRSRPKRSPLPPAGLPRKEPVSPSSKELRRRPTAESTWGTRQTPRFGSSIRGS